MSEELPKGWVWTTLEELLAAEPRAITDGPFGSNLKTSHYTDTGARVLRLQNVGDGEFRDERAYISLDHYEGLKAHNVQSGDLILASLGEELPRVAIVPELGGPAIVKADVIRARLHPEVSSKWVLYALQAPATRAFAMSRIKGVGRPRLSLGEIRKLPIPLPPLAEQLRIVDALDDHLSRLDVATLAVVRAERQTKLLASQLIRSQLGEASELASRWPLRKLADVATIANGQTPKGLGDSLDDQPIEGAVPFVKVGDMNLGEGRFVNAARTYARSVDVQKFGLKIRPAGTVIIPKRGGAIGTNKKRILAQESCYDLNIMGIIPGPDLDSAYLWFWFQQFDLASIADGSNVPQINNPDIAPLLIPMPPLSVQEEVVGTLNEFMSVCLRLQKSVVAAKRRSDHLRRSLFGEAYGGKLVAQDPADEPAVDLLKRIEAERDSRKKPTRVRRSATAKKVATPPKTTIVPVGTQEELAL